MLDEANALAESLLADEAQPERRAKLVALKLALGYPHAFEVTPEDLAVLRAHESAAALARWRAQVWLGSASLFAAAWNAVGTAMWTLYVWVDTTLAVVLAAFVIGLLQSAAGVILAHGAGPPNANAMRVLSALGLLGPACSIVAWLGFDSEALACGLFCAAPSMLVSLAAYGVSRHTAAR